MVLRWVGRVACLGLFLLVPQGPAAAVPLCEDLRYEMSRVQAPSIPVGQYDLAILRQVQAIQQSIGTARRYRCDYFGAPVCRDIVATLHAQQENLANLRVQRDAVARAVEAQVARKRTIERAMNAEGCFAPPPVEQRAAAIPLAPAPLEPVARLQPAPTPTYRTLCVRSCDGYFFPVSFSTVAQRFAHDARTCSATCVGGSCELFAAGAGSDSVEDAVSMRGVRYRDLPNAFRHRRELVDGCGITARRAPALTDAVAQERAEAERTAAPLATLAFAQYTSRLMARAPVSEARAKTGLRDVTKEPWLPAPDQPATEWAGYPPLPTPRPRHAVEAPVAEGPSKRG